VDDEPHRGALVERLERSVRSLGADDLLLFRRVSTGRLVHLGGCGRGEGWAGIVEIGDPLLAAHPVRMVERLSFPSPRQIVGPYHAQSAVLVRREDEFVVVGSRGGGLRLDEPDAGFLEVAAQAVEAITHVSPAKRLGDELELLHAVQDLAAVDTSRTVGEVLHAVGASAASSLSCEVAVVSVPGSPPVVVRRGAASLGDGGLGDGGPGDGGPGDGGPGDRQLTGALSALLGRGELMVCSQEALDLPLPGVDGGIRSWLLLPLDADGDGGLLLLHTEVARGFTELCQQMGRRLAEAAQSVIATALSRQRLVEETRALREAVERDALTGLGNRAGWERRLDEVQAEDGPGADARPGVGVVVCDLDDLKLTNDRHGHAAGDDLLRRFAALLSICCPGDTAVRLGGDEFAVLIRGDRADVERRRDAVVAALAGAVVLGGVLLRASVGLCWSPNPQAARACQRSADAAMYDAKRARRGARRHPAACPAA